MGSEAKYWELCDRDTQSDVPSLIGITRPTRLVNACGKL